jgi:hypothetical protein
MQRRPSCCDFCGFAQVSKEYATDREGFSWFGCIECMRLIDDEDWDGLIERGLAAYAQIRPMPDGQESMLRRRVETLVQNFRSVRLVPV